MDELSEALLVAAISQHLQHLGIALHDTLVADELPHAQDRCPKDTVTLANSGQVSDPIPTPQGVTCVVSFGRTDDSNPKTQQPSAAYAVDVHERIDIPHPNGQAKYLESVFDEGASTLVARIASKA